MTDEEGTSFTYDPAEEERKRKEAELNAGLSKQQQSGGVGDLFTWQNDVGAMSYNPNDRTDKGGYTVDSNGFLVARNPTPTYYEPGSISDPRDRAGYKGPPSYAQDYQASQAWGDYNYNPQGGFNYNLPPGTPQPAWWERPVTARDSQAWGDYNYNPPDFAWNQTPSNFKRPYSDISDPRDALNYQGPPTYPTYNNEGPNTTTRQKAVGGGPINLPPSTNKAPNATRGGGGSGRGGGGGGGFNYGGNDGQGQQSVQAGLMNWRF